MKFSKERRICDTKLGIVTFIVSHFISSTDR